MTLFAAALLLLPMPRSLGPGKANQSFGFNAVSIEGFRTGEAFLTGDGAYNANSETACLRIGGGFRCLADIEQIPLTDRRKHG